MNNLGRQNNIISRRAVMFGGLQLGMFSLLLGRLYYLQRMKASEYTSMAEDNRVNVESLTVSRGRIYDRNKVLLADNKPDFRLVLIPEQADDVAETLRRLSKIIVLSDEEQKNILRYIQRRPKFFPFTIAENLDWQVFARLTGERPFLPGIEPMISEKRIYHFPHSFAHIVGYVGDNKNADNQRQLAGMLVGQTGIERKFERELRGDIGNRRVEVNAYGRIIKELTREEGEDGKNIDLTLDVELQNYALSLLGDKSGSITVMDVHRGDLLVFASSPSFSVDLFLNGIDRKSWKQLRNDPKKPLYNKAFEGLYAPGSVFKIVVALAALQAGVVTQEEVIHCNGHYDSGDTRLHCWERQGHGPINMVNALARSCDTYFYELAYRTGIDAIRKMAIKLGLGQKTGVELADEKSGLIPTPEWKMRRFAKEWRIGDTLVVGIGQGYLLATPLQMTMLMARMANGAKNVKPHLIQKIGKQAYTPPNLVDMDIDPQHLNLIYRGLYRTVNWQGGTAYRARQALGGGYLAGKTGTVQVRHISAKERKTGVIPNDKLPWRLRDHALFSGYGPHNNPQFAITVMIEHGGNGSTVATPIAGELLAEVVRRYPNGRFTPTHENGRNSL